MKGITFIIIGFFTIQTNAQTLENLLEKALDNNPMIQKYETQYQVSSEKVNESNTLPNTQLGVGYFVSEPETRTGAQRAKISVKQMLPWFGSITARENYMSSLADAKYEDIAIAKRKLVASVSRSYYNLYAIQKKQEILKQNISLLETYETLALTSVAVGKASAVDVLRLQMRQNELEQLFKVLEQDYLAEQTAFNQLLNRESTTDIAVVDALAIPEEDASLLGEQLQLHPELIKYDKLYESVAQSELLNRKESLPMVGFGLDYVAVSERPNMVFDENGKDIIMPMVSLSIPVFSQKYKSRTKQNELRQQELVFQKEDRLNKMKTILDRALKERKSSRISYETQSRNLQQAKDAEEILIKSYETGTIDFNDVLDIQELQLKFQISQIESIKNYFVQAAIINYITQQI